MKYDKKKILLLTFGFSFLFLTFNFLLAQPATQRPADKKATVAAPAPANTPAASSTAVTPTTPPTAAKPPAQTPPPAKGPVDVPAGSQQGGQAVAKTETGENGEELVYLNVQDADIKDVIKQISKATGRNFIIDDKIRGKVTIISERPMTREEAYQTFLSGLEVAGYTIVKGPAGVIKIVPLKDAVRSPIPTHVDSTPVTDMFVTRLVPMQNISAVEMANAIKPLMSAEGNMFAYPATNTLIITDSGINIDRMMKIIKELDQEGPQQVLEIIPVVNASSKDIAQMVNQLFDQQKAAGGGKAAAAKKSGDLEEIEEVSKIIPDDRTNAIIVLASRRAIDKVRSIIQKLDRKVDAAQEGKIHVYFLKHAKAKEMAEMLSSLTSGAGAKKDAKAGSSGPIIAEFEGGMKITADESTNSLVITATPKDYQTLVTKVIEQLDVQRRQVYLEAVVMELSVTKGLNYGLGGAFGGGKVGGARIMGADPYSGLLGGFLSGKPSLPTGMLGGLLGTGTVPITIGNTTQNIPSMGLFVSALSQYTDSNIISTPNILTLDNQEAKIEVKRKVWYQGQQTITSGIASSSPQSTDTGLILKITPQIGEADNVRMKIEQELSGFDREPTSADILPPSSKTRNINTSVVTHDGQTVVLGGLMEDQTGNTKNKVPILGDIPILGNLFKQTVVSNRKVNMLVFITPHILKDTSDFSAILKRKLEERNKFIDDNYGKKQRMAIRKAIKNHRDDLLEYKGSFARAINDEEMGGEVTSPPASTTTPPKAPVITVPPQQPQSVISPQKPLATATTPSNAPSAAPKVEQPTGRVKAPVITVPPPTPGTRKDELNLTY